MQKGHAAHAFLPSRSWVKGILGPDVAFQIEIHTILELANVGDCTLDTVASVNSIKH
jgi:hypothetical protein